MTEILDDHLAEAPKRNQFGRAYYFLLVALAIGSIIATVTAWYDVELIVVSGPTMSIVGVVLAIVAGQKKDRRVIVISLIPLCLSIFWLFLIDRLDLSPSDCKVITPLSLTLGTTIIFIFGLRAFLALDS